MGGKKAAVVLYRSRFCTRSWAAKLKCRVVAGGDVRVEKFVNCLDLWMDLAAGKVEPVGLSLVKWDATKQCQEGDRHPHKSKVEPPRQKAACCILRTSLRAYV